MGGHTGHRSFCSSLPAEHPSNSLAIHENNLEIIDNLQKFHSLGYPLLLGASRKSVIGMGLDLPVNERMEGTLVTTVYGVKQGVMFVRVHDVKENVRAIRMTEAIRDGYRN